MTKDSTLCTRRKSLRMTQATLAKKTHTSQQNIAVLEKRRTRPLPALAERIARALGVSVQSLWPRPAPYVMVPTTFRRIEFPAKPQ